MTLDEFVGSLAQAAPPAGLSLAVQGLWWDGKGDWGRAHGCAQDQDDRIGAAVHAYLHRKEGDAANAGYWYRSAGQKAGTGPLEREWAAIVGALTGPQDARRQA